MRLEWRSFLGHQVPRYTSYPTANAFADTVTAAQYRERLSRIGQYEPISLYIHLPFCQPRCHSCGCTTTMCNAYSRAKTHMAFVLREIAEVGAALGKKGRVTSIHFGGGTPNVLQALALEDVLTAIEDAIGLTDQVEIAMEIDPQLVTEETARQLSAIGLTRVSLGVQDFNLDVQHAFGWVQPFKSIVAVVGAFRSNGMLAIDFDLLYGLPRQTPETLAKSIDQAISLDPDRIALFGYAQLPDPMAHQCLIDNTALPDSEMRCDMMLGASAQMIASCYAHFGFDHFAKPDDALAIAAQHQRLKRNF